MQNFLLYGANGYTGELITRFAKEYDLHPILAGRSPSPIESLALRFGYPFLVFDLNDTASLTTALKEVKLVVNAAGPFQHTARQMVEACLQTGTHYIDINGDVTVFEMIKEYDEAAKKAGIMLLPGAGFDVVPTDCLALHLKNQLPDATHLQLAFATLGGGLSHGTATTMVNRLGKPAEVRKDGKIITQALGKKGKWVDFSVGDGSSKRLFVMTIPWGDVSTAYFTTRIPNIESSTGISRKVYYILKAQFLFNWFLRTRFFRNIAKRKINKRPAGPSDEQRKNSRSLVWGKARNAAGKSVEHSFSGPDGYTMTMLACNIIVKKILDGDFKTGYQTPGTAYGENLIYEIPGIIGISESGMNKLQ